MKQTNTEALVIKNTKFQEADKIYTLFSRDLGKISVIAKGVRKITSRRSGSLDTLNHVICSFSEYKNDYRYVNEVKTLDSFMNIKKDFSLIREIYYILEIINKVFWEDENNQQIFDLFILILRKIEKEGFNQVLMNKFELRLMQYLGYEPPSKLLRLWKIQVDLNELTEADNIVKNYIREMLEINIKSLDLK